MSKIKCKGSRWPGVVFTNRELLVAVLVANNVLGDESSRKRVAEKLELPQAEVDTLHSRLATYVTEQGLEGRL